jgi:hypothetical protein
MSSDHLLVLVPRHPVQVLQQGQGGLYGPEEKFLQQREREATQVRTKATTARRRGSYTDKRKSPEQGQRYYTEQKRFLQQGEVLYGQEEKFLQQRERDAT